MLSEIAFYEKYGYELNKLTFLQKMKVSGIDFLTLDPYTICIKIFFLISLAQIFQLIYFFFKDKNILKNTERKKRILQEEKSKYFVVENTNLKLNLFFYHHIIHVFTEKIILKKGLCFEDYQDTKKSLLENVIELHHIIMTKPSEELLEIVTNFKKFAIMDLLENPNKTEQFAFDKIEKKHYDAIIDFLEKKKQNNEQMPLALNSFIEKFACLEIEEN